jgi:SAM-dependent methyltransferase
MQSIDYAKREQMRALIRASGGAGTREGWAALWRDDLTLWDLGKPTPVLQAEVAAAALPASTRVLIPGCGTAYDARALSPFFPAGSITGVDCCAAAIEKARAECAGAPNVRLLVADFFDAAAPLADSSYDLIFDYTFFCAITPAQRAAWGARTAALLAPGGRLLTLAFPLASDEAAADPAAAGPPHPVSAAQYRAALEPHGLRIVDGPRKHPLSVRDAEEVIWWQRAC